MKTNLSLFILMHVVIYFGGCISNPKTDNSNNLGSIKAEFAPTEAEKMTVKIKSKEGKVQRSGFIVAAQEDEIYILTTPHDDLPNEVKIILSDLSELDGEIKGKIDQANDIATLAAKIKKTIEVPYFLSEQEMSQAELSSKNWIKLFGYKMGEPAPEISPLTFSEPGNELSFNSTLLNPQGLSGSPIFSVDKKGEKVVVIGMAKKAEAEKIKAVPLIIIKNYLKSSRLGRTILKQQEEEKVSPIRTLPTKETGSKKNSGNKFAPPHPINIIDPFSDKNDKQDENSCPSEEEQKIISLLADNILNSNIDDKQKCGEIIDHLYKLKEFTKGKNEFITRDKNVIKAFAKLRDYQYFDKQICKKFQQ